MAWCPFATKYELQPESDSQPAIRPTQFIVHSIIAPWTAKRTYEYWRDSTNLESHFGLGYEGDLGQFIGTQTRADANAGANRRADGSGAVSCETASNLQGSDPWTDEQVEKLIRLGVWLHEEHSIPLRICRTHDDPGFGYHRLFPQWSTDGTTCPGDARVRQFRDVVFPGIVARANNTPPPEEEDMTPEQAQQLTKAASQINTVYNERRFYSWGYENTNVDPRDTYGILTDVDKRVKALESVSLTDAQVAALADKVAASPALADRIAEQVADKLAARLAN
jgi:hypothetical protein